MKRDLEGLSGRVFDIVVVGGGVYGAAIAREGASRGLSVALVEKRDFCSGTSANSLKIIHGGLRYLQQVDIPRVLESVRERRALLRTAPHLVQPLTCAMPTGGRLLHSKPAMAAGITLNEILSAHRNRGVSTSHHIPAGHLLSRSAASQTIPLLRDIPHSGAAVWYDACARNTERIVIEMVRDAAEHGACVANDVEVLGALSDGARITGVQACDVSTGTRFEIQGRLVINATGPWSHELLGRLSGTIRPLDFVPALGMNIVLKRQLMKDVAVGLSACIPGEKDRLLFFMPWMGRTMIGTYYRHHDGSVDTPGATLKDIETFLAHVQAALPDANVTIDDIARIHAGVLPASPGAPDTEPNLLKHFQIINHARRDNVEGIMTVLGVKYTTARDVAQRAIDAASQMLSTSVAASDTALSPLPGGRYGDVKSLATKARDEWPGVQNDAAMEHLVQTYGATYPEVLQAISGGDDLTPLCDGNPTLISELAHAVDDEMARTLDDIVYRRTELGTGTIPEEATLRRCLQWLTDHRDWSPDHWDEQLAAATTPTSAAVPHQ